MTVLFPIIRVNLMNGMMDLTNKYNCSSYIIRRTSQVSFVVHIASPSKDNNIITLLSVTTITKQTSPLVAKGLPKA